ncbi:MAG: hypothetical protein ACT4N2_15815 [Hyphomicrobium sp.]
MATILTQASAPAMWSIERGPGGEKLVRLGARRIAVSDIRGVKVERESERDIGGLVVMGGAFLLAAAVFVIGVVEIGWRTRFLVGAVILLALAFVSLGETRRIDPVRFVRLRIATPAGDVVFTTADEIDALALERCLAAERGAEGHHT